MATDIQGFIQALFDNCSVADKLNLEFSFETESLTDIFFPKKISAFLIKLLKALLQKSIHFRQKD